MRITNRYTKYMTTVAVRLPDELVEAIDALVREGRYATRTDAIRKALQALMAAHQQALIDQAVVESYSRRPQTDEEVAIANAATRALIQEEPW